MKQIQNNLALKLLNPSKKGRRMKAKRATFKKDFAKGK